MAANTSESTRTVEPEETHEECPGKKKSKFQAFKKFFVKKKRKASTAVIGENNLKPSQSSSDVSASGANTIACHSDHEPVAKGNMGNKAVSHDSVFVSEMESSVKEDVSQECTPGKVKALQLQLQQNIRIGSPPQGIVPKKLEDSGTLSEDDGLPRSPPEITSLHEILAQSSGNSFVSAQRRSSISLGGTDSEDEPESSELSSRPTSPSHSSVLLCPTSPANHFLLADFTSPASSVTCLDNSAAKHKISVKPKKQRAPTMNVKKTQGINGTNKPIQMKKGEEHSNMIEEQQSVKIPDSENISLEHKAPSEEIENTEDVLHKPKEDKILSVCEPQIDVFDLNSKNSNTPLLLESSLLENQMSFQNEAVCSESDVDFHENLVSKGDQMDTAEEDSEKVEITTSPQTCGFPSNQENITIMFKLSKIDSVEPPESETVLIEDANKSKSQDLVCGPLGNDKPNLEETEVTSVDEIEDGEDNDILADIQNDVLNETESDLVASEGLQSSMLIEPATVMIKDDDVQEVEVVPENVSLYESSNEEHLDTVELIGNTDVIQVVSDQLIANDEGANELSVSERFTDTLDQSITEGNDKQTDVDNITDGKVPAVVRNAKDSSYTNVTTSSHHFGILANSETSTEMGKEIKAAVSNPDGIVKGSNKPVKFTVAPAWQRVLSSGTNVKDSPFIKNEVDSFVRSESFDGTDESVVKSSSKKNNGVQENKEESCGHFGVRLRRTSSSIKYSEEHQEESSRQGLSPVDASTSLPGRNLQTPKRTQVNIDCVKASKMCSANEEKPTQEIKSQPKLRAEEHSAQESSEPAWITMAKLKQKGFQGHPLSKEQSSTTENEKVEEIECIQKKNIVAFPQKVEEKQSEQAAADIPAALEEARSDSEKSTHSTPPQNPDEPPWFSLAKKKAKAWSEMPQIVQQ
ncbi:acrosomal protein KIAA1210 homolog isoform X2 [Eleutherodactylus coqui]